MSRREGGHQSRCASCAAWACTSSVDDFGTGYSSLTYLKRFPVEAIKVDRSFVNGLGIDAEDSTIVEAVVKLGHSLGLQVVAEGVETPLQLSRLREIGCDRGQGYLFGRPRPAELIETEYSLEPRPRRLDAWRASDALLAGAQQSTDGAERRRGAGGRSARAPRRDGSWCARTP